MFSWLTGKSRRPIQLTPNGGIKNTTEILTDGVTTSLFQSNANSVNHLDQEVEIDLNL